MAPSLARSGSLSCLQHLRSHWLPTVSLWGASVCALVGRCVSSEIKPFLKIQFHYVLVITMTYFHFYFALLYFQLSEEAKQQIRLPGCYSLQYQEMTKRLFRSVLQARTARWTSVPSTSTAAWTRRSASLWADCATESPTAPTAGTRAPTAEVSAARLSWVTNEKHPCRPGARCSELLGWIFSPPHRWFTHQACCKAASLNPCGNGERWAWRQARKNPI